MTRRDRQRWPLRRLRVCEGLEPRQYLSGDGAGIQLLPAGFDPADYADIGPQPATASATSAPAVSAAAQADAQARFASAAELEDYLTEAAVRRYESSFGKTFDYNPFGWDWRWPILVTTGFSTLNDSAYTYTRTNVQESGVDEADLVETDGEFIYLLQGQELLIFDARPAEQLKLLSRTKIEGYASGIYLDGDRLTIVSQAGGPVYIADFRFATNIWPGPSQGKLTVSVLDVAERMAPKLISQTEIDGNLVSSRMIQGRLYLTSNGSVDLPLPLVEQIEGPTGVTQGLWKVESEADYRARIRPLLQDQLPHYLVRTLSDSGTSQLLSAPTDIYKPSGADDLSLTSVVVVDTRAAKPGPIGAASVMGATGQMVYASENNLYVLSTRWNPAGDGGNDTEIRKYHFTPTGIEFVAQGEVNGIVLNQFSLSEHAGYLRVATTESWGPNSKNQLFVLGEQGTELKIVGALLDLAPGERIFSARLLGNRGFIVTFRQIDPLFTLDLTDPTNPRVLGELKLPGFSNYLQALDENTLLGIGRDVDPANGWTGGVLVTIFDVSDLASPKVKDQYRFEPGAWTMADSDHHQVLWDPEYHTLAFPVTTPVPWVDSNGDGVADNDDWRRGSALWVFDVSPSLGIELRGKAVHDSQVLRSVRIGDVLYSISAESIQASPILQPETKLAEVYYNRNFVGLQFNLFTPDRGNLLLYGDWGADRFELEPDSLGGVRVRRNGAVAGQFPLAAIGQVVADPREWIDRILVKQRAGLPSGWDLGSLGSLLDIGDADRDGAVGLADFALLKSQFNQQGENLAADADRDGDVDLDDLGIMRSNFGARTGYALPVGQPVEIIPYGNLRADVWSALVIDAAMAAQND
ncbi:MAG: beta-propeller domain-containing protein [Pirellulales bacterium]